MAKIYLDYTDGRFSAQLLSAEKSATLEGRRVSVLRVDDHTYDAYRRHCDQDAAWQALWLAFSNEQDVHDREQALLPLEEAQREIDRLKEALALTEQLCDNTKRQ